MTTDDRCSFCGKKRDQVAWLVAGQGDEARRILDTLRKPPARQS
jgi:ClpX C4-type zinc finger protein